MRITVYINRCILRAGSLPKRNGGFGMNELLGIAAALILAAFVIIPGLKGFASSVMTKLTGWWSGSVMDIIFPSG